MIPDEIVERVRSAADIVEIVSEFVPPISSGQEPEFRRVAVAR